MTGLRRGRGALIALLVSGLALGACGSDDDGTGDDTPDDDTPLLEPPPEGEGHQFTMKTTLEPGAEVEHCMFVNGPAAGMLINSDLVKYSEGSHHVLLFETTYTEIPTEKNDGTPVDTSGVFDCTDGATAGWNVTRVIAGSQNSDGDPGLVFPPDVAIRVQPNTVLLINAHYINYTTEVLEPEVFINLYTIGEDELRVEGDVLFLYNPLIVAKQNQMSRARMRCPVHQDITISSAQSHMHARGVDYNAFVMGDSEPFYSNTEWEEVPVGYYDLGVNQGAYLDYECFYFNDEDHDIVQGPRTTNEMCMLVGSFYPADQNIANCQDENGNFAGEFVGEGTATCSETFDCAQTAFGAGNVLPALSECMYAASPTVARPASQAVLCVAFSDNPAVDCADKVATCREQ